MAEEVKKKSLEKTNPTLKATGSKTAKDATEKKKTTTAKKAPAVKKAVKTEPKPVAKTAVAVEKVETLVKEEKPTLVVERKKIMFVASEALPFVASGGLGEVIGSLPKALANNPNYDIRVVMPLYSIIPEKFKREFQYIGNTQITMAWRSQYCGVFKYVFNGVTFYFLDNEYYFKRSGIYGYLDEAERYTFMSKAALDIIPMIGFIPQIIHCHDWQSALIPVYLKTNYKNIDMYKNIRTVFTIHNMEYQGRYGSDLLYDLFDLPDWSMSLLEYQGDINLMKGAVQCADIVSTVSPSYAKEILDPIASCGLYYINQQNAYKMRGILNGIDVEGYNAKTDSAIPFNFDENTLEIKSKNKAALQEALGLPVNESIPMIAMITRLVAHKGID
ncbi:MAG: glycogen/starch synthase, partial [Clostridia bacterium]